MLFRSPPVTVYVNVLDVTPVTNTEVGVPPYNEPAVVPPLALIVPLDADTDEFKLMLLVVHEPGPLNVTVAFQGPVPDILPTVAIVGIIEYIVVAVTVCDLLTVYVPEPPEPEPNAVIYVPAVTLVPVIY